MQATVKAATIRALADLEQEMAETQRIAEAEALHEALAALARPARGWLSTGQAAERLGVTVPTVKDWIRRGTLEGQPVGSRWRVSEASVDKVLRVREMVAEQDEEGYPSEEEIRALTRQVRRQMAAEQAQQIG
ncbi:MAG TPA: helix-turn-helix domain-containing protein [Chloroflexota bacterium]|nr:helix-turn-helix domain-containing protein [Chloroflexota bacterium]